jgi:uncharacterized protein YbcI
LDRGPGNALAFHRGNIVVTVMHDVLTNAEKALAQTGSRDDVGELRCLFRQVMEDDFRAAVERLTGRNLVAFLGANHLEPDVAAEIFILDAPV